MQKWLITASNSLFVNLELLAELVCFGSGIPLETHSLAGKNQGFGSFFGFDTIFWDLNLVSSPYAHKGYFVVIVVGFVFVKLFLQLCLDFHFGCLLAIVVLINTFGWFQEICCLIVINLF